MRERFNFFAEFLAGPCTLLLRVRSGIGDYRIGGDDGAGVLVEFG